MAFYDDPSGLTRYDSPDVFYDSAPPLPGGQHRMKITLSLSKKTILQIIDFAKLIKNKLTGNVKFPAPNPTIINFDTLITEAETANDEYETARTTADEKLTVRNMKLDALTAGITLQSSYVEDTSTTDADVESAGFTVRAASNVPAGPPAQIHNLTVTAGDTDGSLDVQWDPDQSAKTYEVQSSPDPFTDASWIHRDSVSPSSTTLTGLTSGTRTWVRARAIGTKSQKGPWSEPVSKIVP